MQASRPELDSNPSEPRAVVVYVTTPAERLLGLAHHGFDRGLLGDVRADGDRRRARLTHTFRGLLCAADVAIGGGDARSLAREQQRGLSPYATPRALLPASRMAPSPRATG